MGRVYLATDRHGRLVAIKVIRQDLRDDPTFRARFEREVRSASSVTGRCVAGVIGSDLTARVPYLATEYAAGPTLEQYIKENGPLDPAVVIQLATGLAEGLTAIHRAGLVHRDLSPRNVILAPDGPKIIDFGVARQTDSTTITATGASLGTPSWMAPEQILGDDVNQAADIFAYGALLVYAASGLAPFSGDRPEASAYRIVHEDPDLTAVPPSLLPLTRRALDRDPQQRPTAHTLLASLMSRDDPSVVPDELDATLTTWPFRHEQPKYPPRRRDNLQASTGSPLSRWRRRTAAITAVVLVAAAVGIAIDLRHPSTTRNERRSNGPKPIKDHNSYPLPVLAYTDGVNVAQTWTTPGRNALHSRVTVQNLKGSVVVHATDILIPKSLARSLVGVHFVPAPTSIVNPDPIVRYCLTLRPHTTINLNYDVNTGSANVSQQFARWTHDWLRETNAQLAGNAGKPCKGAAQRPRFKTVPATTTITNATTTSTSATSTSATTASTGNTSTTTTTTTTTVPTTTTARRPIVPFISDVSFGGTVAHPTITVTGSRFGSTIGGSAIPANCSASGSDYRTPNYQNDLFLQDLTENWNAGIPGDCIGLTNLSNTDSQVGFGLGNYYDQAYPNNSMLTPGDRFAVSVEGVRCSGTVPQYPGTVHCP